MEHDGPIDQSASKNWMCVCLLARLCVRVCVCLCVCVGVCLNVCLSVRVRLGERPENVSLSVFRSVLVMSL